MNHLIQDPVTLPAPLERCKNVSPFILGTVRKAPSDENIHTSLSSSLPPSLPLLGGGLDSQAALSINRYEPSASPGPTRFQDYLFFFLSENMGGGGGEEKALRHMVPFNLSLSCLKLIRQGKKTTIYIMAAAVTRRPWISFQEFQSLHLARVMDSADFTDKILLRVFGWRDRLRGTRKGEEGYISFREDRRGSHQVIKSFNLLHKQPCA